ncbi:MAG TPA: 5-oxoprolinase subunit PxpB [Nevskiaceae bacterium]|nr:5-oxoprolinase subunit PxpB [Nevskiaceae bacterium]
MTPTWSIEALGDDALCLRLGSEISPGVNRMACAAASLLHDLPGVAETTASYASVTLRLRFPDGPPMPALCALIHERLDGQLAKVCKQESAAQDAVTVPVCYDGDLAPDLPAVANACGLTPSELVAIHQAGCYQVAMLGFAPGFAYLLGLDPRLAAPRRSSPRPRVPAGSVGIGGAQTGIYPAALPGGWNLIGRTPLRLFDADRKRPTLLAVGMNVRFVAVDRAEFERMAGLAA